MVKDQFKHRKDTAHMSLHYIGTVFARKGYNQAMKIALGMGRENLVREVHVLHFMKHGVVKPIQVDFARTLLLEGLKVGNPDQVGKSGRKVLCLREMPTTKEAEMLEAADAKLLAEVKTEAEKRNAIALGKQAAAARRVELQSRAVKAISQTPRRGNLTPAEIARRKGALEGILVAVPLEALLAS